MSNDKETPKLDLATLEDDAKLQEVIDSMMADKSKMKMVTKEVGQTQYDTPPIIEVNNKDEDKGFTTRWLKTERIGDDFITEDFEDEFEGIVLHIRWEVKEITWDEKKQKAKPQTWKAFEWEDFNTKFPVYKVGTNEVIMTGDYHEFKEQYEGNYDLYAVLYTEIDEKIYKVKVKGMSRGAWFDFQKKFKYYNKQTKQFIDESRLEYNIKFKTVEDKKGRNVFWRAEFEKGKKFNENGLRRNFQECMRMQVELSKIDRFFQERRNKAEDDEPEVVESTIEEIVDEIPGI